MGGSDGIDIVGLAQAHICFNFLRCQVIAVAAAGIMMVDTFQLQFSAVEGKDILLDFE